MAAGDASARTLVVTPTYNEIHNLEPFVSDVHRAAADVDVLIVDDASPDGTGALADAVASRDSRVHVMHRPGKLGLGSAYVDAFRWALARGYEVVFEMDADHSHDPRYIPAFRAALDAGADLVVGSRNVPGGGVEGWGLGRHALSKGGSLYARTVLGVGVRDLTTGFKAYTRAALEALELDRIHSNGYAFQIETTYRLLQKGFVAKEVAIVFVDRRAGSSKMNRKIFAEAVLEVWRLRIDAARGRL
jgi:dolichol-phosphate mannosyltransferase